MQSLWRTVFGNDLPVEVEIGPGTGTFMLAAAPSRPHTNFFGIEHSHSRAARLGAALDSLQLCNARVITADAACVVTTLVPPESVMAYHIYFPDPWWKRRHHRRRLFTPSFAAGLTRTLATDGRLYVATDVDEVFRLALDVLGGCAALAPTLGTALPQRGITAFERKGLARGATIKEATFVKRAAVRNVQTNNAAPMTPAESPS